MGYRDSLAVALIRVFDLLAALLLFLFVREFTACGRFPDLAILSPNLIDVRILLQALLFAFLWDRIYAYGGMYRFSAYDSRWREVKKTVLATFLGAAALLLSAQLVGLDGIDIPFSRLFLLSALCFFLVYRLAVFEVRRRMAQRKSHFVVIVGHNLRADRILSALAMSRMKVDVFDFTGDARPSGETEKDLEHVEFGDMGDFNRKISQCPVDEVIVTLPVRSCYDKIHKILDLCAQQGVRVRLAADLFDVPSKVTRLHVPGSREKLVLYETNVHPALQHGLKRLIDIVGSAAGLILLAPFFLVISLVILAVDGLPVFFVQERVGLNKRRFRIFKFRTMVRDAEELQGDFEVRNEYGAEAAAFKMDRDPRSTRLGRFLRKSSIDELPQLLNVLAGTMSLVGPRPLPLRDFERFYNDRHRLRFSVMPGLTGLWQVSGRNDVEFEEWMDLDIKYAESWSLLLDFQILLKTIFVVISGKGAK